MMKKKILSAVLALSMVAALAGCGGASSAAVVECACPVVRSRFRRSCL